MIDQELTHDELMARLEASEILSKGNSRPGSGEERIRSIQVGIFYKSFAASFAMRGAKEAAEVLRRVGQNWIEIGSKT